MVPALSGRLAERTALSPFALTLERGELPEVFSTSDRHQHVVIRTGAFDLVEASADARRSFVNLFEDLLAGLDVRIQLAVASRLSSGAECADPRLAGFLRDRAETHPSYHRTVHIVLSDSGRQIDRIASRWHGIRGHPDVTTPEYTTAVSLLRHADGALGQLRAMGLHPRLLAGIDLDRFLARQVPIPIWQPEADCTWAERPDALDLDGTLYRTFFIQGYPGSDLLPGWLGPLLDLPAEFDLSLHAFKVAPASALRMSEHQDSRPASHKDV